MENRKYYDFISGLAGVAVAICLFGGLAIQYPDVAKTIGIPLVIAWGIGKFVDWKQG